MRAQLAAELVTPEYQQNEWVECQGYNERPWLELVEFWRLYNRHLAHVIGRIPEDREQVICKIGAKTPLTLGDVAEGYLTHLKHHLGQLGI